MSPSKDFETVTIGDARALILQGGPRAVVVLQEWWGVNDVVKAHAVRLHELGYTVCIPDLYKGKLGVDVEEAHHLMSNLDWPAATIEITDCVSYLKISLEATSVGVIGFCMGGALALVAAQKAGVEACVSFYGVPGADACDLSAITIPVQAHFGDKDNLAGFSDPEAAKKLSEALGGENQNVLTYEGVGHAFMNTTPDPYPDFEAREKTQGFPVLDEKAVALAWDRVKTFFDSTLT